MRSLRLTLFTGILLAAAAPAYAALSTRTLMPEFTSIREWLNTETAPDRSKAEQGALLVVFFSSASLDSYRDFKVVNRWQKKYFSEGLRVVAIHSPEFDFEHGSGLVSEVLKDWRINCPVGLDDSLEVWLAYNALKRPAHYLMDAEGLVRGIFQGRGSYREQEHMIQELLRESGRFIKLKIHARDKNPTEAVQLASPPIKTGTRSMEHFGNPGKVPAMIPHSFEIPPDLTPGRFYLGGKWILEPQRFRTAGEKSGFAVIFEGRKVYAVLGPTITETEILLDGAPLTEVTRGRDAILKNGRSYIPAGLPRLRQIVDTRRPGKFRLEVIFENAGTEIYTLNFE